jgi:hypothetical protein
MRMGNMVSVFHLEVLVYNASSGPQVLRVIQWRLRWEIEEHRRTSVGSQLTECVGAALSTRESSDRLEAHGTSGGLYESDMGDGGLSWDFGRVDEFSQFCSAQPNNKQITMGPRPKRIVTNEQQLCDAAYFSNHW